jgi:DNA-binding winged helix-turn-helix (wHTH) protein/tetratricopeptide (TPR) repeat protein
MTLFRFGPYRLDASTRELADGDRVIPLPPRVFDGLVFLIERRERAVGREEFIDAMWGARGATDVQLAQLVLQCRRAVGDDGQAQKVIRTVAGFGYRWIAPVEIASRDAEKRPPDSSAAKTAPAEPPDPHASRLRAAWLIVAAVVGAFALGTAVFLAHRARAPVSTARVLVMPVSVDDADAKWLRLGGMDVVVDRLRANRVPVLPSDATVAMLRTIDDRSDDAPRAIASFARDAQARTIVTLHAEHANALWRMTATLREAAATERTEHVESADPLVALRLLADEVSGALGFPAAEPFRQTGNPAVALTLQQARAALLANETERARALLMANPALVANEPLLQEQLAEIDIRAGRFDDARKTLDALLARTDNTPAFRATLCIARGLADIRQGRFGDAGDDFSNALDALEAVGASADPIVLGRAYLGRGISRTSLQDYAGAQGDYGRAREAFERAGDPGSIARVDTDIGALENLRGHPAQALPYLERARDRFASLGMIQEEFNVLQLAFVAERMELRNADAALSIDCAWSMRSRVVSPASLLSVGLYRIESLLSLGKLAEADALLAGLADKGRPAAAAEGERYTLMRAALLREQGRFEDALAALDGASEAPHASADDDTVRASVGLLRARLERALGRAPDSAVPGADDLAAPTPRTPLRLLAAANRAWARDDRSAADRAFGRALALADEEGIASTLAAVASDDVEWLVATGRVAEASAVAARVALWADADFDCALAALRVAKAKGERAAWSEALARARRLAGERAIPPALAQAPDRTGFTSASSP